MTKINEVAGKKGWNGVVEAFSAYATYSSPSSMPQVRNGQPTYNLQHGLGKGDARFSQVSSRWIEVTDSAAAALAGDGQAIINGSVVKDNRGAHYFIRR